MNLSNIEQSIDPSSISEISEGLANLSQVANLIGLLDLASGVLILINNMKHLIKD